MAIDFPSAGLTVGQIFTSGGASWKWDGTKWVSNAASDGYLPLTGGTINGSPGSLVIGTPPGSAPSRGTLIANANTAAPIIIPALGGVVQQSNGADGSACLNLAIAIGGNPVYATYRANGTAGGLSAIASGNVFGRFAVTGHDGSNWAGGGRIDFAATQAWSVGVNGSSCTIYTIPTGTTAVAANLVLDGSGNLTILGGTATKPGGGSWVAPSDPRLKTDVRPYFTGLDAILALDPVTFKYNGRGGLHEDGRDYVGLDANVVADVFPSLVGEMEYTPVERDEDGEVIDQGEAETYRTIDNSELVYALVNAVKELKAEIDRLKGREPKT